MIDYPTSLLRRILLAPALVAGAAVAAQAAPAVTRVYGVVASYGDKRANPRGPATLAKILRSVHAFYDQGSGGRHEFVAKVHPQVLALAQPRPDGSCRLPDPGVLSAALRDAGIDLATYDALALVVPASRDGCKGGVQTAFVHRDASGRARRVPLAVSWSLTDRFVAHEILHTHGLGHAKALVCRGASLGADCTPREYGNVWDLMGNGSFQMLSAPLRTLMGWAVPVLHASGRASYTLGAPTRPGGLPTAVQVPLAFTGNDLVTVTQPLQLWIEYRPPIGFDKRMASPSLVNFATGAMVNITGAWQGRVGRAVRTVACPVASPCLVDTTPETGSFKDAGLAPGRTWTEPFTGIQVTVRSSGEETLEVNVALP
ncbi:MAG: hypothetical protein HYZ20_02990 [Burkholderiales bacterium]|nr:hypothetical protein [Burkholderiales bacterium]